MNDDGFEPQTLVRGANHDYLRPSPISISRILNNSRQTNATIQKTARTGSPCYDGNLSVEIHKLVRIQQCSRECEEALLFDEL